ncbi:MAG: MBL fold metallo-hydrolase [Bacilli bacterium]|nr:MBL fold metallo-hydrolase [Bacilli bacterium]
MRVEKLVVGLYEENCYFLIKGSNLIIIDPGDEFNKIDKKIIDNNLNLVAILITHAHFDHIGALDSLLNKYKIPVYYNNINKEILYDKLINVVENKYEINNFKFEVTYTKGHRNDSVTYYFYDDNIMFTGDFIFKENIGRMDLEYASINDMKKSIEMIKKYPDDIIIYPGHGDKSTLGYEKENNYYFI